VQYLPHALIHERPVGECSVLFHAGSGRRENRAAFLGANDDSLSWIESAAPQTDR